MGELILRWNGKEILIIHLFLETSTSFLENQKEFLQLLEELMLDNGDLLYSWIQPLPLLKQLNSRLLSFQMATRLENHLISHLVLLIPMFNATKRLDQS